MAMEATIRQQIISLLREEELEARDLSGLLSIPEKEVYPHLEHIERSLGREGGRLLIRPCQCLSCGSSSRKGTVSPSPDAARSVVPPASVPRPTG